MMPKADRIFRMIFWAIFFGTLVCGAVLGTFLTAQGAESASPPAGEAGLWMPLLRMGSALAAVLGFMLLVVYALRRFGGGRLRALGGNRHIRMVANQFLGGKNRVSVVEVDGARFLLGISAERVTLLCRLDETEWRPSDSQEESAPAHGFPFSGGG